MKARDIKQDNKSGPNIVGDNIKIGKLVSVNKESEKKERIPIGDNSILHNLNLWLYGSLFKKFGFVKTGVGFGISGGISLLYLIQNYFLKWFQNNYLTIIFIVLFLYSIYFFQYFRNRSCPGCKAKFSLVKKGTYKVGECKVKGVPHDINEEEFKCAECGKTFIEQFREAHEKQTTID
ncbi:MAG: hypothetical protein KJ939_00875 [Nanoarchaeota archaeon]|nr:hypothetical protein [Nanoarchaeota archaeon]